MSTKSSIDKVESDKYAKLGEDFMTLIQPAIDTFFTIINMSSDFSGIYNTYILKDLNKWTTDCSSGTDTDCANITRQMGKKYKTFLEYFGLGAFFKFLGTEQEKQELSKLAKEEEEKKESFMNISGNNSSLDIGNIILVLLILFILFILVVNKSLLSSVNNIINFKKIKKFFNKL